MQNDLNTQILKKCSELVELLEALDGDTIEEFIESILKMRDQFTTFFETATKQAEFLASKGVKFKYYDYKSKGSYRVLSDTAEDYLRTIPDGESLYFEPTKRLKSVSELTKLLPEWVQKRVFETKPYAKKLVPKK